MVKNKLTLAELILYSSSLSLYCILNIGKYLMETSVPKSHVKETHEEYTCRNMFVGSVFNGRTWAWSAYNIRISNEYVLCLQTQKWARRSNSSTASRSESETLWSEIFETPSYNDGLVKEFFNHKSLKRVQDGKVYFDPKLVTEASLSAFLLEKIKIQNIKSFTKKRKGKKNMSQRKNTTLDAASKLSASGGHTTSMLDLINFWKTSGNLDNLKPTFIRDLIKRNKLSVGKALSLTPDQRESLKPLIIQELIKKGKLTVDTAMLFTEKSSASDLVQLMRSNNELFKLTDTDFRFIAKHFNAFKKIKDNAPHHADIYGMVKMGPEVLAKKIKENIPYLFTEKIRMRKVRDNHYDKMIMVNGFLGHMQFHTSSGEEATKVLYMFSILGDKGCGASCYGNRSKLVLTKDEDENFVQVDKPHMETMLNTARATMENSTVVFYNRSVVFFGKQGEIREPQNLKFG